MSKENLEIIKEKIFTMDELKKLQKESKERIKKIEKEKQNEIKDATNKEKNIKNKMVNFKNEEYRKFEKSLNEVKKRYLEKSYRDKISLDEFINNIEIGLMLFEEFKKRSFESNEKNFHNFFNKISLYNENTRNEKNFKLFHSKFATEDELENFKILEEQKKKEIKELKEEINNTINLFYSDFWKNYTTLINLFKKEDFKYIFELLYFVDKITEEKEISTIFTQYLKQTKELDFKNTKNKESIRVYLDNFIKNLEENKDLLDEKFNLIDNLSLARFLNERNVLKNIILYKSLKTKENDILKSVNIFKNVFLGDIKNDFKYTEINKVVKSVNEESFKNFDDILFYDTLLLIANKNGANKKTKFFENLENLNINESFNNYTNNKNLSIKFDKKVNLEIEYEDFIQILNALNMVEKLEEIKIENITDEIIEKKLKNYNIENLEFLEVLKTYEKIMSFGIAKNDFITKNLIFKMLENNYLRSGKEFFNFIFESKYIFNFFVSNKDIEKIGYDNNNFIEFFKNLFEQIDKTKKYNNYFEKEEFILKLIKNYDLTLKEIKEQDEENNEKYIEFYSWLEMKKNNFLYIQQVMKLTEIEEEIKKDVEKDIEEDTEEDIEEDIEEDEWDIGF